MDGYITKPISSKEVEAAVMQHTNPMKRDDDSKHAHQVTPILDAATHEIIAPRTVAWDSAKALERVDGDEKLLHDVMQIFLEETPSLMDKLRSGVNQRNAEAVEHAAHSLKGELLPRYGCHLSTGSRVGRNRPK
jgi:hypothetical protein